MEKHKKPANSFFLKPSAPKYVLLLLHGILWLLAGSILLSFSYQWVLPLSTAKITLVIGCGFVAALLIHHFGFLKVIDKNIRRISAMDEMPCIFAFMSWKSYLLVVIMMGMGIALRHSPIAKPCLAIIYTGIGLALIFSSIRSFRAAQKYFKKTIETD